MTLEGLSQIATVATGIAAAAGLIVAAWQIRQSRVSQERATAYQIYAQFLAISLEHPQFLNPIAGEIDIVEGSWAGDKKKFGQYEIFIDLMVVAFEEMLRVYGKEADIEGYMKSHLEAHREYLCSSAFSKYDRQLDPAFRKFYRKLCSKQETSASDS